MKIFLMLILCSSVQAQFFTMQVTDYGFFGSGETFDDQAARDAIDTAVSELQTEVNTSFPDIDQSRYLKGMANSNAIASKGAVDTPLADFELFSLGYAVGGSVDLGENSLSSITNGSVKAEQFGAVGLFFGMNFGVPGRFLGLESLIPGSMVLINFMSIDQKFSSVNFKNTNMGVRVAFPWIEGTEGLARWSGVRLSTGIEYSTANLIVEQSLNTTIPNNNLSVGANNFNFDAVFNQTATFGAELQTISIPFEIATGGELLHTLGGFLGLGLDLNFGKAKSIVSGGGPVTFDVTGVQNTQITAVGSLNAGSSEGPRFENLRFYTGMNFDFYLVNFYFQYNQMLLDPVYSLAGGIRTTW